jgi:hypothetical protein
VTKYGLSCALTVGVMSNASHAASHKLCRIKVVRIFESKDETSDELRLKQSHI